ncbi:unnamed protein product [Sphagnum jensenii]|uniref:Uncharacterized protein n=1 Tax=Sphagnum jensenii TaxID=128206 RepID=A0ABP1A4Q3_9BRYO
MTPQVPCSDPSPRTQSMILRNEREKEMGRNLPEGGEVCWPSRPRPMELGPACPRWQSPEAVVADFLQRLLHRSSPIALVRFELELDIFPDFGARPRPPKLGTPSSPLF